MGEMMAGAKALVKTKEHPPFAPEIEGAMLLNPIARTKLDKAGELSFPAKFKSEVLTGIACVELISVVPSYKPIFVVRNSTDAETVPCRSQPHPETPFASPWAGKEAALKALGAKSKGVGAAVREIAILPNGESAEGCS